METESKSITSRQLEKCETKSGTSLKKSEFGEKIKRNLEVTEHDD